MQTNPLTELSSDDAQTAILQYLSVAPTDFLLSLRRSLDSPRFVNCRSVMSFVTHYNLQLKPSEADDYTLLPPGTYTHRTLPYGPVRLGIRRGDVAYVATESHGVVEVHLSNMDFHPDSATPYRGSGKPPVATAKPSSRKGQPAKEFAVGDIVKDEFGTKHVVDEANIDRLRSLLGKLDFTYVK